MKKILVNKEAQDTILAGLKILHDPVASTLGPSGRNVLIETQGTSYITKDGATVARYIEQLESDTNQGIRLLKMVSQRMAKEVGDGTTTATIIAYRLLKELIECVQSRSEKISILELEEELARCRDELVEEIKKHATNCIASDEVRKIANVSTNNNKQMAENVVSGFYSLDPDATILLEEHQKDHDEVVLSKGFQWTKGYMSQQFITDMATGRADLENALIFMTTDQLTHPNSVRHLMAYAAGLDTETEKPNGREPRPLIIVARDVRHLALAMLIDNHKRYSLKISLCAIEAPGGLDDMARQLEDLRAVVGGKVYYNHETGKLRTIKESDFGKASKVIVEGSKTTILVPTLTQDVLDRVNALKLEKESASDPEEKEKLKNRIARLMGEMYHIKVGAPSKVELMERRDRYEDAIYAVRSALKHGFIPGGGVIQKMVTQPYFSSRHLLFKPSTEAEIAKHCLYNALAAVPKTLYENSGRASDYKLLASKKYHGFDLAKKDKNLINLFNAGILEPVEILLNSLDQAISLASTVLRTNTLILYDRTGSSV